MRFDTNLVLCSVYRVRHMSLRRGNTRTIGKKGERIAADFLVAKGYVISEMNFQKRYGEVDIIAWHDKPYGGKTLCFIEVKFRIHNDGSAERSVGEQKFMRMKKGAIAYCIDHHIESENTPIQFEQISIYGEGVAQEIFHYDMVNT